MQIRPPCERIEKIYNLFPHNTTSTGLKHIVFGLQDYHHSIFRKIWP